jgi:hypothetical protein
MVKRWAQRFLSLFILALFLLAMCSPAVFAAQSDIYKNLQWPFYDPGTGDCVASGPGSQELEGHKLPAYTGGTGSEEPINPDGSIPSGGHVSFSSLVQQMTQERSESGSKPYRNYAVNMRWTFVDWAWDGHTQGNDNSAEGAWFTSGKNSRGQVTPRLLLITNPQNGKSVIASALESGPAPWTGTSEGQSNTPSYWQGYINGTPPEYKGRVSGLTPAAFDALGGPKIERVDGAGGPDLIYSWAPDQEATPGPVNLTQSTDTNGCCPSPTDSSAPDFVKMYGGAYQGYVDAIDHGSLDKPNTIVIHYTEGTSEGIDLLKYFAGTPEKLGAQFNIGLTGKVYEYYPLDSMRETYHAKDVNSHAIGIEISGKDGNDLINNGPQFNSVVNTVNYLCNYYGMPCGDSKGDITKSTAAQAQGMLGHDEAPSNDHSDPDTKMVNGQAINISTGEVWQTSDRYDASIHAYMLKLRQALGYSTGGCTAVPSNGTIPSGTNAELAQKILNHRSDGTYRCDNSGDCSDLEKITKGQSIKVGSPGGSPYCGADTLDPRVLKLILYVIETGNFKVGTYALCGDHHDDGPHGHAGGFAVDFSSVNGVAINAANAKPTTLKLAQFLNHISGELRPRQLITAGYGNIYDDDLLALEIPNSAFYGGKGGDNADHKNHIHTGY